MWSGLFYLYMYICGEREFMFENVFSFDGDDFVKELKIGSLDGGQEEYA